MIDDVRFVLTLLAALGSGLVAGTFFAFSAFVMKALSRLPPGEGMAAMQSINVAVLNPWFLAAFSGTGAAGVVASMSILLGWQPTAIYLLAGTVLYLGGNMAVTLVCNVPRNESLAAMAPAHPKSAGAWTRYVASWTAWNHVRTAAALAAAAAFTAALVR
jgi:uncharacterized membrane protein